MMLGLKLGVSKIDWIGYKIMCKLAMLVPDSDQLKDRLEKKGSSDENEFRCGQLVGDPSNYYLLVEKRCA